MAKSRHGFTYHSDYRPGWKDRELRALSPKVISLQEQAYLAWKERAGDVPHTMGIRFRWKDRDVHGVPNLGWPPDILSASIERESDARQEEWITTNMIVRRVKSYAKGEHFNPAADSPRNEWTRLRSDAPTLYAVIHNGKWVDAYLTKGRAKAAALALLAAQRRTSKLTKVVPQDH